MPTLKTQQIADHVGGVLSGDPEADIVGIAPADTAQVGFLTFAENERYLEAALNSKASAILIPKGDVQTDKTVIQIDNVRVGFAKVLTLLYPENNPKPGIHPTAVVAPSANIAESAYIGPNCIIEAGASVGEKAVLSGHVFVGTHASIGDESAVFPHVTL